MKHFTRPLILACTALTALCLMQTSCSVLEPKADNTKLYVLRAQPTKSTNTPAKLASAIRVGPGRVAAYLDVTPIVVQDGPNTVKQLGQHHWAEPLSKGISRVLAENLAQRLGGAQMIIYPEPANGAELEVRYTISQLEGALDGPVQMNINWQIVNLSSGAIVRTGSTQQAINPPRDGASVPAYVERLSAAIGIFADETTAALASP